MGLNGKYRVLYGIQGLLSCTAFGYTAYYLTEQGFGATQTGMVMAIFSAMTAGLLPVFGRIADRSRRFHWKAMLLLFNAASLVLWGGMLVCGQGHVSGILFQIAGIAVSGMFPMINVACFYYEKRGKEVNFGVARGMNSLFYAIGASLIGRLTLVMGSKALPWVGFAVSALLMIPILQMPYEGGIVPIAEAGKERGQVSAKEKGSFIRKYPAFIVLVCGCVLMMTVYNLTTTFMIWLVEDVGGNSSDLGTAITISALAEVPIMLCFSQLVKRVSERKMIVFAGFVYTLRCAVLFGAQSMSVIYLIQLTQTFSFGLYNLAPVYFCGKYIEEEDAATGQTLLSMCGSAGSVIGSLMGGWLVEASGVRAMLFISIIIGIATTCTFALAMGIYRRECRLKGKIAPNEKR